MNETHVFPLAVQEVLTFIAKGELLNGAYQRESAAEVNEDALIGIERHGPFTRLDEALSFYQDQDVEPPYVFLPDMVEDADGDIPPAADASMRELARALILYEEEQDFVQVVLKRLTLRAAGLELTPQMMALLADKISGELYLCAKARLLAAEPHPFFETLFSIYRNQELPVGWIGEADTEDGRFVVYSPRA
ncbi:hypothetical protein B9G55_02005 [Saccharibacillus sp. O16]|nr:hypothetical protein B9G55_02005 [Saccharibacillus sp. O16]